MIGVFVMPLETWLGNQFRPGPKRTPEDVAIWVDAFVRKMDGLLAVRPEWDSQGSIQSATAFSLDAFFGPFEEARSRKLRALAALVETPQIWLPSSFEPVFRIDAPGGEVRVASSTQVEKELASLSSEFEAAERLRTIARSALEHHLPVIVEG